MLLLGRPMAGTIPEELANMVMLKQLYLNYNQLSGKDRGDGAHHVTRG